MHAQEPGEMWIKYRQAFVYEKKAVSDRPVTRASLRVRVIHIEPTHDLCGVGDNFEVLHDMHEKI